MAAPDPTPRPAAPPPAGPLAGLLVVDLSRVLAGPYCAMTLGDLGARVIKVERPGEGDDTRRWGPPFWGGESTYSLAVNRNKESIALDLRSAGGRAILWALLERADVLIENFRPGALADLGFGYDACRARNRRLVYASVSGYGLEGPDAARPGYDLVAQGEGGAMSVTGEAGGPPLKAGVSQADIVTGLWLLAGILAALHHRERSGEGQRVDAALLDGQIGLLTYHAANLWATGEVPVRMGNRHPNLAPYGTYRCADAWITVAVGTEAQFHGLCAALGEPELAGRAEFATPVERQHHRDALEAELAPRFAGLAATTALERLARAGVPSGRVRSVAEALAAPQVAARDMIVALPHPTIPGFRTTGLPVKLSATPGAPRSAPPRLAEHTGRVLAELGYDATAIARLRAEGAIA